MNEVLTRDLTSGRIHRRIAVPGGYATLEGDNLDEAGEFEVAKHRSQRSPFSACC